MNVPYVNEKSNILVLGQNPACKEMGKSQDPYYPFRIDFDNFDDYGELNLPAAERYAWLVCAAVKDITGEVPNVANLVNIPTCANKITEAHMTPENNAGVDEVVDRCKIGLVICFGRVTYNLAKKYFDSDIIRYVKHPNYMARFEFKMIEGWGIKDILVEIGDFFSYEK